MRNFNYPNTCWRNGTTEGHKQSTRFLECFDDNFQTQVTEELMMGDDLLDLIHINKEKLTGDVKVRDNLNCSDHKMVAFCILRRANKANSKITALDFRMADFSLFRDMLGRNPWDMALERRGAQESYLVFKDHPLQA